jgi:hypothetical protein
MTTTIIAPSEGINGSPVSQICAFTVFPSTLIDRVANSTPIVDLDSRLNSLRVKRESTITRHFDTNSLGGDKKTYNYYMRGTSKLAAGKRK